MNVENLRSNVQELRLVGHHVERDARTSAWVEVDLFEMLSGKDGGIHKRLKGYGLEDGYRAARRSRLERCAKFPARRKFQTCLHLNLPDEVAGWIQRGGVPVQAQHFASHRRAPL